MLKKIIFKEMFILCVNIYSVLQKPSEDIIKIYFSAKNHYFRKEYFLPQQIFSYFRKEYYFSNNVPWGLSYGSPQGTLSKYISSQRINVSEKNKYFRNEYFFCIEYFHISAKNISYLRKNIFSAKNIGCWSK